MALPEKTERVRASTTVKQLPDLPAMPGEMLLSPGAAQWNTELQVFWEKVKERLTDGTLSSSP